MALSLEKEQQKVKLSLEKVTKKPVPPVQVKLVADVSGSMSSNYNKNNGYMFPILQRSIALASIIDPDKVVQIIAFDTNAYNLGDFGVDKFDEIWKAFSNDRRFWGGTDYAKAFNEILDSRSPNAVQSESKSTKGFFGRLFGKKEEQVQSTSSSTSKEPELIIFFTDGANGGSSNSFNQSVRKVLDGNTYLMCIGAGGSKSYYSELKALADERDDVGFVYFDDPNSLTDNAFYDTILSGELGEWLETFA